MTNRDPERDGFFYPTLTLLIDSYTVKSRLSERRLSETTGLFEYHGQSRLFSLLSIVIKLPIIRNFDYPKNSIFRSDSSVPIKEIAIKLPFKIQSPNITHGDHDFFVWSSSIYTPEWFGLLSDDKQRSRGRLIFLSYPHTPDRFLYSQISVIRTSIIRNYWVNRIPRTVATFFSIIYCNKTTYYSNFDYPKNSIFRSDSSVPIKEIAIKLPFKIQSPNVTHGDHDFFVWSSSIYTPEWFGKQSCNR